MALHAHQRLRHDVMLRMRDVLSVERLSPHMQRVTLGGPGLRGFHSASPDDHVKLFFPNRDGELVLPALGANGPEFPPGREPSPMRDYTPRHHDAARGELTVDFVLHGDGPASNWAAQAAPGQQLGAGGPRGSFVIADDFDHYVLAGGEALADDVDRDRRPRPQMRAGGGGAAERSQPRIEDDGVGLARGERRHLVGVRIDQCAARDRQRRGRLFLVRKRGGGEGRAEQRREKDCGRLEAGADIERLKKDMEAPATRAVIEHTVALGDRLGLTGTPAFVIGDEVVFGAVGAPTLKQKIESVRKCGKATCSG